MEEEEMLEQTNDTENVESQTTEEIDEGIELTDTTDSEEVNMTSIDDEKKEVKTFTQEEVDAIVQKRLARKERDFQKELSKYKSTEEVLKAGLNATDINDAEDKLREYWGNEGIKLPDRIKPGLTEHQLEVLARDDAKEIIDTGDIKTIEYEANRLASIGWDNMNHQEKVEFQELANYLTHEKDKTELLKLGAKEEILSDKSFNDFRKKFANDVPISEIYDMYMKNKPKTVKENPGSMKNSDVNVSKDFYTLEEIAKLSDEQLDDPKIWDIVRKSMTKNKITNYYE